MLMMQMLVAKDQLNAKLTQHIAAGAKLTEHVKMDSRSVLASESFTNGLENCGMDLRCGCDYASVYVKPSAAPQF